ncbi:MAG: hypothetical protein H7145_19745 [Akkermansiaceae bacterium]|nr:hypothetical protein [Armatimonadota bacterium]
MRTYTSMGTAARLAVISLGLFVAGCGGGDDSSDSGTRGVVSRNRELWESRNTGSYRYTLLVNAFLPTEARGPVSIEVRDGVTVAVRPLSDDVPISPEQFANSNTIDKLFDRLESAADSGADRQDHQFDPVGGYPVSAFIDYDVRLADEEYGFTVTDYEPLPSD